MNNLNTFAEYYMEIERDLVRSGKPSSLTYEELQQQQETKFCEAGYRTYTGHCMTQAEADSYNRYTEELNRTRCIRTREYLKDQRHRMFCIIAAQAYTEPKESESSTKAA
jgi:hypothetical protein